jgi:hypothetical protein
MMALADADMGDDSTRDELLANADQYWSPNLEEWRTVLSPRLDDLFRSGSATALIENALIAATATTVYAR